MCCNISQLVIWPHEELSHASYRAVGNPDRCCYCCLSRFAVPHFFTEHPAYRVPTLYTHWTIWQACRCGHASRMSQWHCAKYCLLLSLRIASKRGPSETTRQYEVYLHLGVRLITFSLLRRKNCWQYQKLGQTLHAASCVAAKPALSASVLWQAGVSPLDLRRDICMRKCSAAGLWYCKFILTYQIVTREEEKGPIHGDNMIFSVPGLLG